ncbi:Putative glycoside hydrolase family 17, glycoside hydrolase superfamily [Septoria linicola]|uniref:glucan 1,3-beta-glucosidase n=1 Tax=Septoria linicola TaxID=215465 RepID=A0A9Q9EDU8_9PEZI|nr:putative glycoside hydrolase family 17, glycoside hydrolase superfamily [Septoria linicola]USW47190.1 Putative glycoside hydrolase family 17, glycoside hydrolase superfamily [Septoria linicola]
MRATLAALALAAMPAVLAAEKGIHGFALGTKKSDGTCKFRADYEADFDAIKDASGSTVVRGYSASDCNCAQEILPAAKNKGFKVVLGVWPDVEESFNTDKEALTANVPNFKEQVYAITVGSETLYRGNFTGEELLEKIMDVKEALGGDVKVGTADSWNKWADGTGDAVIKGGVDIIMANGFSYWQGAAAGDKAKEVYLDDIQQALGRIQEVSGSLDKIEFWNGETGWPTDGGSDYEAAQAGTKNAEAFYHHAFCGALDWGINAFYFEAFDEPWKPESIGDNGVAKDETHWGAMTADRESKFDLKC